MMKRGLSGDNIEKLCRIEWNVREASWAPDKKNIKWVLQIPYHIHRCMLALCCGPKGKERALKGELF